MSRFASLGSSMVFVSLIGCASCAGTKTAAPLHGTVNPEAEKIEGLAEDAFDRAMKGQFAEVVSNASQMAESWKGLRPAAIAAGLGVSTADLIDRSIEALATKAKSSTSKEEVARAANAVSATMDELYAIYSPSLPVTILELDYLGRELWVDALTDLPGATAHLQAARAAWSSLRPALVAAEGSAEATAFDGIIASLGDAVTAQDAPALLLKAQQELDEVDNIEKAFSRSLNDTGG